MESNRKQILAQKTPAQKEFAYNYMLAKLASIESAICPLSLEKMSDPVFYIQGTTKYICERSFLLAWLKKSNTCPFTQEHLSESDIRPDHNLRQALKFESRPMDEMVDTISLYDELLFDVQCNNSIEIFAEHLSTYVKHAYPHGWTILHYAMYHGNVKTIDLLIKADVDIHAKTEGGKTALFMAIDNGYVEVVKQLLNAGAADNEMALKYATLSRTGQPYASEDKAPAKLAIMKILLTGAKFTDIKEYQTLLHANVMHGNHEIVKFLLDCGLPVNDKNEDGDTPLHKACLYKNNEVIVGILLNAGADVRCLNNKLETPIQALKKSMSPSFQYHLKACTPSLSLMENKCRELEQAERENERLQAERENERLQAERENERLEIERAASTITFDDFYWSYNELYNSQGLFAKNPFSAMNLALTFGTISTIREVKQYISDHPDSRAKIVFDGLIATKMNRRF